MPGLDLKVPPQSSKVWCYSIHFKSLLVLLISSRTFKKYLKSKLVSLSKITPLHF